jgi:hypothetical protein
LAVFFPWFELGDGSAFVVELVAGVELGPGHDLFQAALQAGDLRCSDICKRGDCVSVERAEGDLVEVDETNFATARAGEGCCCVRANATAANNDHESVAEFGESFVSEKDAVSCQLFQNECFVVVAQTSAAGEGNASLVFFVQGRFIDSSATEVVDLGRC